MSERQIIYTNRKQHASGIKIVYKNINILISNMQLKKLLSKRLDLDISFVDYNYGLIVLL